MAGRSIQERLLLAFIALVVCTLLPLVALLHRSVGQDARALVQASLERETLVLASELDRAPPDDVAAWVMRVSRPAAARLTVIAPDGRVLADSEVPAEGLALLENHAARAEVAAALAGRLGSARRRSATQSRDLLYVAAPVGSPPRWALRLALPLDQVDEIVGRARTAVWLAALAALVLAILLGATLARRMSRPLVAMTQAARAMSHGDFGAPLPEPSGDELGELVHALETLRSQMAARLDELRDEGKKLRTILNGMDEGVALIQDGAIVIANPAFSRLLGANALGVEGARQPLEVSRLPSMAEVVEKALAGKEARCEVLLGARSLSVQAHPLGQARTRQAVLVLFDTTEAKRLERLRRDFVANASHELRTPVAAIVGVADTLTAGAADDPEARQSFIEILSRHARRLEHLTADLLDLARMEGGYKPRVESVPVDAAIEAVVSSAALRAPKRSASRSRAGAADWSGAGGGARGGRADPHQLFGQRHQVHTRRWAAARVGGAARGQSPPHRRRQRPRHRPRPPAAPVRALLSRGQRALARARRHGPRLVYSEASGAGQRRRRRRRERSRPRHPLLCGSPARLKRSTAETQGR